MNNIKLLLWITIFITKSIFSQNVEWTHYTYEGNQILALKSDGDFMWVGTSGGIVSINTRTDETKFYTYQSLPSSWIISIAIDNNGNKWFAGNGLIKYDGSKFTIFNTSNSKLPDNGISSISVDSKNNLWIGTGDGVVKYDGNNWTVYKPSNSGLPDHDITSIAVDRNDVIWIGIRSGGLVRFDGLNWSVYNSSNSTIPDNSVIREIKIDKNGNKFVPFYGGIAKFNDTLWTFYKAPESAADIRWMDIDTNADLWLATSGGVLKYDGAKFSIYNELNPTQSYTIIEVDNNGNKWIGSNYLDTGIPLQKFDGVNWLQYNTSSSFSYIQDNAICSIAVDSNNIKWIAGCKGVIKYDSNKWVQYDTDNSTLPSNYVSKIVVDKFNNKWFGTSNGLAKYDDYNWSVYPTGFNEAIKSITIAKNNSKWVIGSYIGYDHNHNIIWGNELWEFDDMNWINHTQKSNYTIGGEKIYLNSIYADTDGYIWIATNNGLIKYDGVNQTLFNAQNSGLKSNIINDIVVDEMGNKWIATNNGIAKYDNKNWTIFNKSNSELLCDTIQTIVIDKNENQWISTGKGLISFDGSTWKTYNDSNSGLYNNQDIFCIAIDKEMNKWFGLYGDLVMYSNYEKTTTPINSNKINNDYFLSQNYPNPFNPNTTIIYSVPKNSFITIKIFDALGREIKTLVSEEKIKGIYSIKFEGSNLSSGIYFYQLKAEDYKQTKKMILIR